VKVREIKQDDVVILELSGRMTEGKDTDALSERINKKIDEGLKKLIFDLNKVHWIDSSGLGLLIRAYTRMQKADGELKLARVTRSVNSLLQMTKLTTVFAIHDTLEEATESF
jgi:anti-sigma B factor antagonist